MLKIALVVFLLSLRIYIDSWPIYILQESPNMRYIVVLSFIWAIYTILKHNGLLPKKQLQNQHVVITGGAMGIGNLMAKRLLTLGCKVTILDINEKLGQQAIQNNQKQMQFFKCNVADKNDVKYVFQKLVQTFGEVDILINNAGIVTGKKLLDNTEEDIERTFQVNTLAHFYTIRQCLPSMIKRNSGHIVTIASILGHLGASGVTDYCTSKFAAVGLDDSLRQELSEVNPNIKMTCICPGHIDTGMFDGGQYKWITKNILPVLQPTYVSKRIIDAIQQNEDVVLIPYFFYPFIILKSLIPVWMNTLIQDLTGANTFMNTFKGRQQK